MSARFHFQPAELVRGLAPGEMGLRYTSVRRIELSGAVETVDAGPEEICLAVIDGRAGYRFDGVDGVVETRDMLYLPRGSRLALEADAAVVMRFGAPAHIDTEFAHVAFAAVDADPVRHAVYGKPENNTRRDVWHFLGDGFRASRLMMGITRGAPGGWTGWPPHEHGAQREEVYAYFGMGRAFALQCVYQSLDDPRVALVRDGHLIAIPSGFHPNVGCPAGAISFVYCMVATTAGKREFMDLRIQEIYGDKFE